MNVFKRDTINSKFFTRRPFMILFFLFMTDCAGQVRFESRYAIVGTYESTHRYLLQRLTGMGWRIFTRQTRLGHIVAANNETYLSRDVVFIDLNQEGNISIWIRTEEKLPNGDWLKPDRICEGYNWIRERQLLSELMNR